MKIKLINIIIELKIANSVIHNLYRVTASFFYDRHTPSNYIRVHTYLYTYVYICL